MAQLLDEKGNPLGGSPISEKESNPEPTERNHPEEAIMGQFIVYMSRIDSDALIGTTVKEIVAGFFDELETQAKEEVEKNEMDK